MKRKYRSASKAAATRSRSKPARTKTTRSKQARAEATRESSPDTQAAAAVAEAGLPLDRDELLKLAQDSVHTFAVELGLLVAGHLLDHEVDRLCGPRYARDQDRTHNRHGSQGGMVTLAGQKVPIRKPRVRGVDGSGEVELETYALLQRDEAMPEASLRRMVRGVSCRNYEDVIDVARAGFGVKKSSVSRSFVRASAESIRELAERDLSGERFVAVMIDGIDYAGETMVVALGITADGHKRVLGLRQGATENAEVVTSLLEELSDRGLATGQATLFVLDGAKALHAGVRRVWGRRAVIQRCQIHKQRNVLAHVPEQHAEEVKRDLHAAWQQTSHTAAKDGLERLAKRLKRIAPDAARSLQEGLDETITIIGLGLPALLSKTLKSTNPIESALDTVRTVTRRVKRWRDGDMRLRWCSAGLLRAEASFNRIQGYKEIPQLVAALEATLLDTQAKTA